MAIATQKNKKEFADTEAGYFFKENAKVSLPLTIKVFFENTRGLSEVYNEVLDTYSKNFDVIIFIHDDVFINDKFFIHKLTYAFTTKKFDVVGIAGTKYIDLNADFISWYNVPADKRRGMILHSKTPKEELPYRLISTDLSVYDTMKPPREYEQVLSADGVFLAIKTSTINAKKIRFDPQFEFNFYDLDFCLSLHKHQLKLGIAPILITHNSIGEGILSSKYLEDQTLFLKKWNKRDT